MKLEILFKEAKTEVENELRNNGIPVAAVELAEAIVKMIFSKYGYPLTSGATILMAFTTTAAAEMMRRHLSERDEFFKEKFGVKISSVQCDEINLKATISLVLN